MHALSTIVSERVWATVASWPMALAFDRTIAGAFDRTVLVRARDWTALAVGMSIVAFAFMLAQTMLFLEELLWRE